MRNSRTEICNYISWVWAMMVALAKQLTYAANLHIHLKLLNKYLFTDSKVTKNDREALNSSWAQRSLFLLLIISTTQLPLYFHITVLQSTRAVCLPRFSTMLHIYISLRSSVSKIRRKHSNAVFFWEPLLINSKLSISNHYTKSYIFHYIRKFPNIRTHHRARSQHHTNLHMACTQL